MLDLLESNRGKGLDIFEIEHRHKHFGPNLLTVNRNGPVDALPAPVPSALIYILITAGAITAFLQEWVDSVVIFGVVLVNAVIGYIQEAKAVKAMDALARTMIAEATVLRAGTKQRISAAEPVPGDIVYLQSALLVFTTPYHGNGYCIV